MYFLTKFCCFCLHEKDNLINVNNTNFNNVNIMNKLMFCVISDFSTVTIPIYICLKCCSNLETACEFKLKCLENFNRFLSYDRKLNKKGKSVCKKTGIQFPESIKPARKNKTISENVNCVTKRCCFCLNEEGNLISLNGRQFENINVLTKVMFCINQNFDTEIPTFICTTCSTKLESTYQFKKICLGSFNRFQSYLRKLKYVNNDCQTRYMFKEIQIFVSDLRLYKVKLEERDFETQNENRAVNESIEDNNGNDSAGLLSTLVDRKDNQQVLDFEDGLIEKMNAEALNKIDEDTNFMKHDPTCNSDEGTCLKQETPLNEIEEITELESIESPIVTNTSIPVINERASLKCPKCGQCFTTKQLYDSHAELHENSIKNACTVCGKVHSSAELLQLHTGEFHPHLILYPFECPACDMSYITKPALDKHTRNFHHFNLNDSNQVKKPGKDGLYKVSRMSHKINKLNLCFVCKKKFLSLQELKNHVVIHSNEAPFMCTTCGKGFKVKNCLTRHMFVHNEDERPWYYCSKCEKRYASKFSLKSHLAYHANKLRYECSVCSKLFWQKRLLNLHMLKCHMKFNSNDEEYQLDYKSRIEGTGERVLNTRNELEIVEGSVKAGLNEEVNVKYSQNLQTKVNKDENKMEVNESGLFLKEEDQQDDLGVEGLSWNCDEIEIVENSIKTELNVEDIAEKYNQILQEQICEDENKIFINRFDSVSNKKDEQKVTLEIKEKSTLNEDTVNDLHRPSRSSKGKKTLSKKLRRCPICEKTIVNLKRHMRIHTKEDSLKFYFLKHNNIKHPYQSHKEVEFALESLGKGTLDTVEIQDDSETCQSEKSEEIQVESQDLNAFDEAIQINDENLKQSYPNVINIDDENLHPENLREKAPVSHVEFETVFID